MKRIILPVAIAALLTGCFDGGNDSSRLAQSEIGPSKPITLSVSFSVDGVKGFGKPVRCNEEGADSFVIKAGDSVSCEYNGLTLASFKSVVADVSARTATGEPGNTYQKTIRLAWADEFVEAPGKHYECPDLDSHIWNPTGRCH
ncbi:hypothetical protein [Endozoicomonas acroporae]|uniref:hypothetical protein n=1 Tax=Endozoicomonas acroporae TaxID=1701104 RepID=UPI003D7930B4